MNEPITITMPDQDAIGAEVTAIGGMIAPIKTAQDRIALSERVGNCKRVLKQIAELFADSKKAANDAHKAVCAAEKRLSDPVNAFVAEANKMMWTYDDGQERKRRCAEEQLRREAEARAEAERKRLAAIAARCKDEDKREAYMQAAESVQAV